MAAVTLILIVACLHVCGCLVSSQSCEISGLVADCSRRKLRFIPSDLGHGLTHLNLRDNLISSLDYLLRYPNLRNLDLSFNNFTRFPEGGFAGLDKLESLDLRYQSRNFSFCEESLPSGTFAGTQNLTSLRLGTDTKLCYYPTQVFSHLIKLEKLFLEGEATSNMNNFVMPPLPEVIRNLTSLVQLEIVGTRNIKVTKESLESVRHSTIKILAIRGSKLKTLTDDAISNISQLETLNLSFNPDLKLDTVWSVLNKTEGTLLKAIFLDSLTDGTSINIIPDNVWCNKIGRNLEILSFKGNNVPVLSQEMFACLPNIRILDLSYTPVMAFSPPKDDRNKDLFLTTHPKLEMIVASRLWFIKDERYEEVNGHCNRENTKGGCDIKTSLLELPSLPELNSPLLTNASLFDPEDADQLFITPESVKYLYLIEDRAFQIESKPNRLVFLINNSILYINITGSAVFRDVFEAINGTYAGFIHLRVLDLSYIGIQIFSALLEAPNLRLLNLSNNLLGNNNGNLDPTVFRYMTVLSKLILSNNKMRFLSKSFLDVLPALRFIDLSYNKLQTSSAYAAIDRIRLDQPLHVNLDSNVMTCDCDFVTWLNVTDAILQNTDAVICSVPEGHTEGHPEGHLTRFSNINQTKDEICSKEKLYLGFLTPRSFIATIVMTTIGAVTLVTTGFIVIWRNRKSWLVKYYLWQVSRREETLLGEGVYVIYDEGDARTRRWAAMDLYGRVTGWGVSLYVRTRHAVGGGSQAAEIVSALSACRAVLIVLTRGLFREEWADLALYSVLALPGPLGKRVCVLNLGGVERGDVPRQFRPLFYPKTYLTATKIITWKHKTDNKKFWLSLKKVLLRINVENNH